MKLELKHLAPYLPYNLKGNYEVSEVVPSAKFELRNKELRTDNIDFFLKYAKPILRPLSDLTKEIEVNGEKFIPIVELFNLRTQKTNARVKEIYIKDNTAVIECEPLIIEKVIHSIDFFEIDLEPEDITFSLVTELKFPQEIESFYLLGNEFKMYQRLFEWHFDVFGLIEKGLAVNINTLQKTPF